MDNPTLDSGQMQIRLLHLHPGRPGDELVSHFTVVSLDSEETEYEALSYAWGDSTKSCAIQLENMSVPITANLWQALMGLRHPDKTRVMWVDALCINQSDNEERSNQVSLMRFIYMRASSVEIWLGESYEGIELALEFFTIFARGFETTRPDASYEHFEMPFSAEYSPETLSADGKARKAVLLRYSLTMFSQSPWFERTWTVQEFHLARNSTLHYGACSLNGAILIQALVQLTLHQDPCYSVILPLDWNFGISHLFGQIDGLRVLALSRPELLDCVASFRRRKATDPRDKIYGLLGLISQDIPDLLLPNYALAVEEVFENFTISILQQTKNLDIFSHLRTQEPRNLILPSFVPDWTLDLSHLGTGIIGRWMTRYSVLDLYDATLGAKTDFIASAGVLSIRGKVVDIIELVATSTMGAVERAGGTPVAWNMHFDELLDLANVTPGDKDPNSARYESFWLAMCAETFPRSALSPCHDPKNPKISDGYHRIGSLDNVMLNKYENLLRTTFNTHGLNVQYNPPDLQFIDHSIALAQQDRRFTLTQEGRMGLVPIHTKKGDVVAVLTGGRVPIVLRPEKGFYTVVGDCYVQGIMDGEAMRDAGELNYIVLH